MPLRIQNSLTKQKEDFKPLKDGEVKMYVCGPTVYDEPHIGHLRSAYVFDVMRRWLEKSYKVTFVRNVTDVDDKIIQKALESKPADLLAEVQAVSEKYLRLYKEDLKTLGILEPTVEPKATMHIQDMQWLITKLIEAGKAYASDGDVYFDVNGFAKYGQLSHQNKEAMLQGARVDKNEKKKDALDFALWKKAKEGEPSWPSPWGAGRPGWHIECSAMSMKYLGQTFDIHGGGRDLIFPHHENEIAQSEACTGAQFARYWIHHGLITTNQQKMSKSLKNYVTLKSCANGDPENIEVLKFLFLKTHYSSPLDYNSQELLSAKSIRNNFKFFFDDIKLLTADENQKSRFTGADRDPLSLIEKFSAAMDDDFNTSQAITEMHQALHAAHKHSDAGLKLAVADSLKSCLSILGLNFDFGVDNLPEIENAIRLRNDAKKNKDYVLADKIKNEYLAKGIEFFDTPKGTSWRKR